MEVPEFESSWQAILGALRDQVKRVITLLRSIDGRASEANALGQWNLADVAAHLAQVWIAVPGLARGDVTEIEGQLGDEATLPEAGLIRQLGDLSTLTTDMTKSDDERNLDVLADRIQARSAAYFAACASADSDAPRPWLIEGISVPASCFAGHLLSECIVHGHDLATAAGKPWPIEAAHARFALERFLFPVMAKLDPHALVNAERADGFTARFEIRVRGGDRFRLRFEDSALHVEPLDDKRVDCYLSAAPAALLLLVWGRQSQWPALLRGHLFAWGPKPWLAMRLPALMKNP